jgi:hypothetical protein
MSGYNYTPVRTPEQRIQDLENQNLDALRRNQQLQDAINKAHKDFERRMKDANADNTNRENQHKKVVESLTSDIKEVEKVNQRRLEQQRQAFEKAMDKQNAKFDKRINKLAEWTEEELEKQRREYLEITDIIEDEIKSMHEDVATLRDDVDALINTENERRQRAHNRLIDLNKLIEEVDLGYPHQRFTPGELNEIKNTANDAQRALNNANAQEASVYIREGLKELTKLREKILRKQMQYDINYSEALKRLISLLERAKNQDVLLSKNGQNRVKSDEHKKIDYWTEGTYSKFEGELKKVKSELERNKDSMTLAEVQREFERIGQLENELNQILKKATNSLLASMERTDIARKLAGELYDPNGYYTVENGFESGDPRKSYLISTRLNEHPEAPQIVIVIEPKEISDLGYQNMLVVNTTSSESDEDKRHRAARIAAVLKSLEVEIGNTTCVDSNHIKELEGDRVKEIVRKGSTGIPEHIRKRITTTKN